MATWQQFGPTLEDNLDAYAKMCEYNRRIEEQVGQSKIIDFRLESLIEQPKKLLVTLCRFLEVDPSDAYLSDCESVVAKTPSRTRSKVEWSPEAHRRVEGFTEEYRFLNGYTFDD